ncbi:mannose-1-phosphate guanylyltransferase [bacterium]|nr:MAG: mannose-1-phosphate guanylyltransferase [bacterium]
MKQYAVIMAGGVGTRFWPQSREAFPKQFLTLFGNRSLIQQTVDRISKRVPLENILIITNQKYIGLVNQQLPEIPLENILGEPIAKNTAPCVALAAEVIHQRDGNAVMAVLPADHIIFDENTFLNIMDSAFLKAQEQDAIVTVGIQPSHPETGYGYIHFNGNSKSTYGKHDVHAVHGFKEKPDLEKAKYFLETGEYLWNSGMFIWSVPTIRTAYQTYLPDMFSLAETSFAGSNGTVTVQQLTSFFNSCASISVDYGIMEKAKDVFVVPGSFGWNDVGSWSAVYDLQDKDENGNVKAADIHSLVNTKNSYVSSKSGKIIALVGVNNLAVIETDDAILVCNLDASQDVKKVVESLKDDKAKFK